MVIKVNQRPSLLAFRVWIRVGMEIALVAAFVGCSKPPATPSASSSSAAGARPTVTVDAKGNVTYGYQYKGAGSSD